MVTVNVIDLFLRSAQLLSDGIITVDITEFKGDEDSPSSLEFDANIDEYESVSYEPIYSFDSPDAQEQLEFDEMSPLPITLNFNECKLLSGAMHEAIQSYKTKLNVVSLSADERSKISQSLKELQSFLNGSIDAAIKDFSKVVNS